MSWTSVAPLDTKHPAPSARSKHGATIHGEFVYVIGGRNGNLPCKDFWKYHLGSGKWSQLKPTGDKLPSLQEHTAITYKENIYVFGGEVGFSAGTETPLWVYDIKDNSWKKVRTKKGVVTPKGRRGHTALVHNGLLYIYGGYQDLRGSTNELWTFHFETESWHLLSSASSQKNNGYDQVPPARHKHSAVLHGDAIWIYGGMTDLQERSDLWKYDILSKTWTCIKAKIYPGPLHSHVACSIRPSMIVFGGERNGQPSNDLWKFNYGSECWEKITICGSKPQPRSESVALAVSELLISNKYVTSVENRSQRIRSRTCASADRGNRHSSYVPHNKVAPCENTYVFDPSNINYNDGSTLAEQYTGNSNKTSRGFLQEISKLSQFNVTRLSNNCSYTVLTRQQPTDSTENLLRQHSSPQTGPEVGENEFMSTPLRGSMVKSKSAYVIKKKYLDTSSSSSDEESKPTQAPQTTTVKKRVEFDANIKKIPREPISVPNFATITLPVPVLTPVEATKLVYLTDEENDLEPTKNDIELTEMKHGDSYSSHLGYADNPLYQQMITEKSISSTSDYASIETVNRLSSTSSYSMKTNISSDIKVIKEGPFGFCNPNYNLAPSNTTKSMLTSEEKKELAQILSLDRTNTAAREPNQQHDEDEDMLELQNYSNGIIDRNSKVVFRHGSRTRKPPVHLPLDSSSKVDKHRALSAGRVEQRIHCDPLELTQKARDDYCAAYYVFVFGGKEQGHVTVFQRPLSIWKLKL